MDDITTISLIWGNVMLNWKYCTATEENESDMYKMHRRREKAADCIKKDRSHAWRGCLICRGLPSPSCFLPYQSDDLMPLRPRAAERGLVCARNPCLPHPVANHPVAPSVAAKLMPRQGSRPMPQADIAKLFLKTSNIRWAYCECRGNPKCWSLLKAEVEYDRMASLKDFGSLILWFTTSLQVITISRRPKEGYEIDYRLVSLIWT